jgi:D-glycero-beta-D-manno-heptose-7-phosphate kinase
MNIGPSERAALSSLVKAFVGRQIVVLGDLVADEFIYGEIARVSREAPVLILKQREKQIVPGGGANAANNLADLGARVTPVGAVGDDEAGAALLRYFEQKGISTRSILRVRGYQTPTKSRILGGLSHWQRQQIVRVDREPAQPLGAETRRQLARRAAKLLSGRAALLVSDYGYGAVGPAEVAFLRPGGGRKPPLLTLDSRYSLLSYARITAATPNEPEIEEAFGRKIGSNLDLLYALARLAVRRLSLEALVVTRGRDGMVLFEPREKPRHIPIFGSDQVADVTGAGDTVIAAFTLALAAGASYFQAAQLSNIAGGMVVMKRGTATVTGRELQEAIRNA